MTLGAISNKALTFKRVAEKDIKRIVEPSGLHFKNNPIKAFYNANFYEPKADALNRYAVVINQGAQTLFDKINPFKSIIANFAKANNKELRVIVYKNEKNEQIMATSFLSLNKKGQTVFPAGAYLSNVGPSDSKRDALEKIYNKLNEIAPGEKTDQFYFTAKKADIDAKPSAIKK